MDVQLAGAVRQEGAGGMDDGRVRPFSNGFEYEVWQEANCERCVKAQTYDADTGIYGPFTCDIEEAVALACIGSGEITAEIAARMGWSVVNIAVLGWPCGEFVPLDEPTDVMLRRTGAVELPLFEEATA